MNQNESFMCEICHNWCFRVETTKKWWDIARKDWKSLNGKDLPYYIAILAVLRETIGEIYENRNNMNQNHSNLSEYLDKYTLKGYNLMANANCKFEPLTGARKDNLDVLFKTICAFRNGAAHLKDVSNMNPVFLDNLMNPEDSTQEYYRYAPYPHIKEERLFIWDQIPGKDDKILVDFLNDYFKVKWVKTAKIEKIENDKTIRVFTNEKSLSLKLNNEKTKVSLEIDNVKVNEFTLKQKKKKKSKLQIYENNVPLSKIHKFVGETILANVRTPTSNIPAHQIVYELSHVERGPLIDLLHDKMMELLKETKAYP